MGMTKPFKHVLFLVTSLSLSFPAFAANEDIYRNSEYRFGLRYPSPFHVRSFGEGYFDILEDDKILLRASVEDDTFRIFIKETTPGKDIFQSFARARCRIVCDADGPDGSTYCDGIENETQWVSRNGLRVLEFTLIFTRENYEEETKERSRTGPVYIVEISSGTRPLALIIHPGHGVLTSESEKSLIRGIVNSVELMP
jgi:hypothetical protein